MLFPFSFMKTVPVAPVATAATGVGETSFTANWDAFTGATYYLLDVSTSPSFSSFVLQDEFTTSTSYVVIGLTASTTYYYRVRANVGVDPDAQAFFDRVTTAGGTLSATEQTATNQLVLDMKAAGVWTKMKAVYPMVGASAAACAQNLVSSSFTGTFTSGWTFSSTGVTGNGTSAYMNTGFSANTNQTVNNCSVSVYVRTATASAGSVGELGATISPTFLPLLALQSTGATNRSQYCWDYNAGQGLVSLTTTDNSGMWGVSRSGSTSWQSFERNTPVAKTTITSQSSLPTANIYIGAVNDNGTAVNFSFRQIAFAHMGDALSNTQFANFYTAVQTFQTTLSRQV